MIQNNEKEIVTEIPIAEAEAMIAAAAVEGESAEATNNASNDAKSNAGKSAGVKGGFDGRPRRPGQGDKAKREASDGFDRKLVQVNRVTKVVKGGKTMRFNALIVVGDKQGKVGLGMGKAAEVPTAVEKAVTAAKRNLVSVNLAGHTIPHSVVGKFGAASVLLMPAKEGTGVIAGASARSVLELVGIHNIACKSYGSRNKINAVKATMEGLKLLKNKEQYAAMRGKKTEEI